MGLYINYRGKLRYPSLVKELVAELEDIAKTMKLPYEILDGDWEKPSDAHLVQGERSPKIVGEAYLKGIIFKPLPSYDPVKMTFDSKGELHTLFSIAYKNSGIDKSQHWLSSKLSNAPDYVHIGVCKLLRHLEKKYFARFKAADDTGYWKTGNEQKLAEEQLVMKTIIGIFKEGFDKNGVNFLNELGIILDKK